MHRLFVAVATVVVGVGGAGTAHADEAGYLAYLQDRGFTTVFLAGGNIRYYTPEGELRAGYRICSEIHSGSPANEVRGSMYPQEQMMVDAAQHELCPDTLH